MAAPTLYLDVSEPTADRMDPCPVFAALGLGPLDRDIGSTLFGWTNAGLPTGAADQTLTIAADTDDAYQLSTGAISNNATFLRHRKTTDHTIGLRFTAGTTLPDSKYIVRAELRATVESVEAASDALIYGDDQLASPTFAGSAGTDDVITRTSTTANVAWSWGADVDETELTSLNISTVLQEIYDLGERDIFTLLIRPGTQTGASTDFHSRESSSAAPELDIWLADEPIGAEYKLNVTLASLVSTGGTVSNVTVLENGSAMTPGTVGSLAAGEYGVSGGELYVRLSDDADPETKAVDYVRVTFDVSTTGDSSRWDQCKITWELTRSGGFGSWPDRYRYVTDTRPGMDSAQVDLATAWRGGTWGAILTAGTWTIAATVTNPSGDSDTVTSDPIVVAANTRTEVEIDSGGGGDYTTFAAAIAANGATDDIAYKFLDGHAENITSEQTITGANAYFYWDGTGTKPVFTFTADANWLRTISSSTAEHCVVDRLGFASSGGNFGTPVVFGTRRCAVVGCTAPGTASTDRLRYFTFCFVGASQILAINNTVGATVNYSFVLQSWTNNIFFDLIVAGNDFGISTSESVVRFNWQAMRCAAGYNKLDTSDKSTVRFSGPSSPVDHHGRYGWSFCNYHVLGTVTIGESAGSTSGFYVVRIDQDYLDGTDINPRNNSGDITIVNCIIDKETAADTAIQFGDGNPAGDDISNIDILHNTITLGDNGQALVGSSGGTNSSGHTFKNNIIIVPTPGDRSLTVFFTFHASEWATGAFDGNVIPESTTHNVATVSGVGATTINDWNALDEVGTDSEADVTLDAAYRPTPTTSRTTVAGVFEDYYGATRGATSWAGATDEETEEPVGSNTGNRIRVRVGVGVA